MIKELYNLIGRFNVTKEIIGKFQFKMKSKRVSFIIKNYILFDVHGLGRKYYHIKIKGVDIKSQFPRHVYVYC